MSAGCTWNCRLISVPRKETFTAPTIWSLFWDAVVWQVKAAQVCLHHGLHPHWVGVWLLTVQKRLFWPRQRLFDQLTGFGQNLVSQMCPFRFWYFGLKTVSVDHYLSLTWRPLPIWSRTTFCWHWTKSCVLVPIRSLYYGGTFNLMSTKCCPQPDEPPCISARGMRKSLTDSTSQGMRKGVFVTFFDNLWHSST